jgi:hypothetical protein
MLGINGITRARIAGPLAAAVLAALGGVGVTATSASACAQGVDIALPSKSGGNQVTAFGTYTRCPSALEQGVTITLHGPNSVTTESVLLAGLGNASGVISASIDCTGTGVKGWWSQIQFTVNGIVTDQKSSGVAMINCPVPPPPPIQLPPTLVLSQVITAVALDSSPSSPTGTVHYAGGRDAAMTLERALVDVGLNPGPVDGSLGTSFTSAYAAWQRRLGYTGAAADGVPGYTSLTKLGQQTSRFLVVR